MTEPAPLTPVPPKGHFQSALINSKELSILPGCTRDDTGRIRIDAGASGYVAYGPYSVVPDGEYLVEFRTGGEEPIVSGSWELFDGGQILFRRPANRNDSVIVELKDVGALEVRLLAEGDVFFFSEVELTPLNSSAAVLEEKAKIVAAAGCADTACALIVHLAVRGDSRAAAAAAGAVSGIEGTAQARSNAAWHLVHQRNMVGVLDQLAPRTESRPVPTTPALRIIDISGGDASALSEEGLLPQAALANARDSLVEDIGAAHALGIGSPATIGALERFAANYRAPNFRAPLLRGCNGLEFGFQATALKLGHIFGRSLWTGAPMASSHSYVLQIGYSKQVYSLCRFEDVEPWYLMVGTWRGSKSWIFLPGRNLLIALTDRSYDWGNIVDWIDGFKALTNVWPGACNSYLERETRPAVYAGGINNLGHFFWNDVQGMANARDNGLLENVSNAVLFNFQFLDLCELFPELRDMQVMQPSTTEDVFFGAMGADLFCVRPTALALTDETAALVMATCRHLASQEQKQLAKRAAKTDVTVWFNLRSHNKVWLNQVECARLVMEKVLEKSKSMTLLLDGTPDCVDLVSEIRALAPSNATIIDATRIGMADSIMWAGAVDAYVATIGSGLTLTTWIAGKPGVAHSETTHLQQMQFWPEVRPNAPPPLVPQESEVRDVGKGMYCNYEIDPRVIATLLMRTIRNRKP